MDETDAAELPSPSKASSAASAKSRRRAAAAQPSASSASAASVNPLLRSLNRLADVELQLICHSLSAADVLRVGRCSRRMRHTIDAPFAWRTGQIVTVVSSSPAQISILQPDSTHAARHAPVSVRWLPTHPNEAVPRWDGVVALAAATGRVHGLDASSSSMGLFTTNYWPELLSDPFAQQLRVLRLHRVPHPEVTVAEIDLICALPLLHTLEILLRGMDVSDRWSSLPSAPSLRCLTMCDPSDVDGADADRRAYQYVARCSKLLHLRYESPGFHASFLDFCAQLNQLESLVIDTYAAARAGGPSAEDYAAAWTVLTRLRHLHLRQVTDIDLLLPSVARCSSLRTLVIEPTCTMANAATHTSAPSLTLVRGLLTSNPRLQLRLQFDARLANEVISDQRRTQTAQLNKAFPGRFHNVEVWRSPFEPDRSFQF